MIATLTVSFGLLCVRSRAGRTANPTVAAALLDRNTRRLIMADLSLSVFLAAFSQRHEDFPVGDSRSQSGDLVRAGHQRQPDLPTFDGRAVECRDDLQPLV